MRAADLDDLFELRGFGLEGVSEARQGGDEGLFDLENGGDVHDCGKGVVGGGGHVDVVVGVDGLLGAHGPS